MPEPSQEPRTKRPRYREIAGALSAWHNCVKANNLEWRGRHYDWIEREVKNGPSGSGIDCGTKLDWERSTPEKLIFLCDFHHMNANGYYDGWTGHTVIVTPSLQFGYDLRITGRNRNEIKEYLHEVYSHWLTEEIEIS